MVVAKVSPFNPKGGRLIQIVDSKPSKSKLLSVREIVSGKYLPSQKEDKVLE